MGDQEIDSAVSNASVTNATCCSDESEQLIDYSNNLLIPFTLGMSVITFANVAVSLCCLITNSLLLWGIACVDIANLRAKRFIQSLAIAELILSVGLPFDIYTLSALGGAKNLCFASIYLTLSAILGFVQGACVLLLAADRIFAVVQPLKYRTTGYGKSLRFVLVILPWFVGFFLMGIFEIATLIDPPPPGMPNVPIICAYLTSALLKGEELKILDIFITVTNLVSFFIYITIFGVVKIKERTRKTMTVSVSNKASISLARTYFLINVTTLALYLPGPVYYISLQTVNGEFLTMESVYISSGLMALFKLNYTLDPIILMSRIISIRSNLPLIFKSRPKKPTRDGSSVTKSTAASN